MRIRSRSAHPGGAPPTPVRAAPLILALVVGLVAGACASTGSDGERVRGQQAHILTEEQIRDTNLQTAFDVVRSLRPSWLRERPSSLMNPEGAEVVVYVDGVRMATGIDSLRQIRSDNVTRMEFMTPNDATTRYGTGHFGGAILVTTRRG